jgi:membrane protease subunit (stomatin/prohibitin family)
MGIASFVKKQFIDVLQWTEDGDDVLAWRFPTADLEIQQGARLIVRDTQMALFVDQGTVADLFGPGTHPIRTRNLPVLTDLRHWNKQFESPFKSEVYFFSVRQRLGQTWGTANALTIRDREFGAVRIRAFGVYGFRVGDPRVMFRELSGTRDIYGLTDIEGQLRNTLVSALTDHLGGSQVPFLDMAANQEALARAVLGKAQNISLPEELQERLDERIGMGIVGDLPRYTQFQTARSIPTAAANAGGAAGAGVGVGAGIAMGQAMGQAMQRPAAPSAAAPVGTVCPRCSTRLDRPSKFCPECGNALA